MIFGIPLKMVVFPNLVELMSGTGRMVISQSFYDILVGIALCIMVSMNLKKVVLFLAGMLTFYILLYGGMVVFLEHGWISQVVIMIPQIVQVIVFPIIIVAVLLMRNNMSWVTN
ncbi:hypothetical protein J4460_02730 [Candidatus Woesearchaeota archaeon]|nr:hypothetical protein [Candidatus Woesearchaeota archaeon]HIH37533.1 hypothetical protein [Candidatus Woesearchaeota archaeon]HIH49718.1 hypothetical protein [Candidatus Woesearchaeota archaeon]HIJ03212.1 hypothetical protein [Candidatus Woesearchaeota archaeon]